MKPILLCGIPASGKSTYGRWLEQTQGWIFVDVEEPGQLERANLNSAWAQLFEGNPLPLIDALQNLGRPVVLAWGFPPDYVGAVAALNAAGMSVWWFDGDRGAAREAFIARDCGLISDFDAQIHRIESKWRAISDVFRDRMIESVHSGPRFEPPESICERVLLSAGEMQTNAKNQIKTSERSALPDNPVDKAANVPPESLDPNDSNSLRDRIRGQTVEHADPPRLEDEGQSGG